MRAYRYKEKAGVVQPALSFLTSPQIERLTLWLDMGRVRRLLRFSLADGERRKSRKPAPLPTQCSSKTRTLSRGYCIERCRLVCWGGLLRTGLAPHNGGMPIREDNASASARSSWESFLHRPPLLLDRAMVEPCVAGKRVLITGAGGWIGSALAHAVAEFQPERIVLLEAAERNLYELELALRRLPVSTHYVLGSVSDPTLLTEIFRRFRPHVVYHAAAFKHVPMMEQNPFAAIENNTIGTNLLAQAALDQGTEQLILLSTDKAVDPVSIMGASKRLAELILLARMGMGTRMTSVRLGNVFGSAGSIVPLFRKQIQSGGPVTVTDPDVRRYFITREDAVTLLLMAASMEHAQGILVPQLGEPVLVRTVAEYLIAEASIGRELAIVFTHLRPGDKMCEALLSGRESYTALPGSPLRSITSPAIPAQVLDEILQQLQQAIRERSLQRLLTSVLRALPDYQPSAVIKTALAAESGE
jgi:FlaA1/EpsC-like NDP-sugar epimerase